MELNKEKVDTNGCLVWPPNRIQRGYCSQLRTLKFMHVPNVVVIGPLAFEYTALEGTLTLPNVQLIEWRAFRCCRKLTYLYLPEVRNIGVKAFEECSSVTTVFMPHIESVEPDAFCNCESLNSFDIGNRSSSERERLTKEIENCEGLPSNITIHSQENMGNFTFTLRSQEVTTITLNRDEFIVYFLNGEIKTIDLLNARSLRSAGNFTDNQFFIINDQEYEDATAQELYNILKTNGSIDNAQVFYREIPAPSKPNQTFGGGGYARPPRQSFFVDKCVTY